MKKNLFVLVMIIITISFGLKDTFAQIPERFLYQAEARDSKGKILAEEQLLVQITILNEFGDVYTEKHTVQTDMNGLFELEIGNGEFQSGTDFSLINWSDGTYKLNTKIAVGVSDNYTDMGTTQFLSVPYALYAKSAASVANADDADADPTNELQTWENLPGIPADIADGDDIADADADPTNEIQDLVLNENLLRITRNEIATDIDLSPYFDNTNLTEGQVDAMVANNGFQMASEDYDTDNTNEIQTLTYSGDVLGLTFDGTTIDLSKYLDDTDEQTLSINGHTLSLSNGNAIELPDLINDDDADPANELQSLSEVLSLNENSNNAGEKRITNLSDPVDPKDAATKEYVDQLLDRIVTLENAIDNLTQQVDNDLDGYSELQGDCDDTNAQVYPGAADICGDGIDQDCNGDDAVCGDEDGDGYLSIALGGTDCDDSDNTVYPGAPEICNDGVDNDCDGNIDCLDNDCENDSSCQIQPVDLVFLIDNTGGMSGSISNIVNSFNSEIIPALSQQIEDLAIGVSTFQDFPIAPYGESTDKPYELLLPLTSNTNTVFASLSGITVSGGNDAPESGNEALYQVATGAGLDYGFGVIPATQTGFRDNSKKIIIVITNAVFHDISYVPYPSYFGSHSKSQAISALNNYQIYVAGINVGEYSNTRIELEAYANSTNAVIPATDGLCPTGINGTNRASNNGSCPLVFDVSSTGTGIGSQIISAVLELIGQ